VEVTIGICTARDSIFVFGNNSFNVDLGDDQVICDGGSVTLDAGVSANSYLWNTLETTKIISVITGGAYSVTASSGSCIANDSVDINISQPMTLTLTDSLSAECDRSGGQQGFAMVVVSGGAPPYTYLWNDAAGQNTSMASALVSDVYTVIVTDQNACTASDSIEIEDLIILDITGVDPTCVNCADGSATVTVSGIGSAPYTYRWSDDMEQTSATATGLKAGRYTVIVTDTKGCTKIVQIDVGVVSVKEISQPRLQLFPNPSDGRFTVSLPFNGVKTRLTVVDLLGRLMFSKDVSGEASMELSFLGKGTYLLIATMDKQVYNMVFVVQ